MNRNLALLGLSLFALSPVAFAQEACNPVPDRMHLKELNRAFHLRVKSPLSLRVPRKDAFSEKRNRFYTDSKSVEVMVLPNSKKFGLLDRLKGKMELKPGTEIAIKSRRFNSLDPREVLFAAFVEKDVARESTPHVFSENLGKADMPFVFDCFEHTYLKAGAACTVGMLKKALRDKVDVCYSTPDSAIAVAPPEVSNIRSEKKLTPTQEAPAAPSSPAEAPSESSAAH